MPQTPPKLLGKLLLVVVALELVIIVGCHRGYYRRQADAEAKCLVTQKSVDPRWNSATGSIEVDPYSRMFNPFSSDHPPLPPDDPTSSQLMHCVAGKRGYPHWEANGKTDYVENPEWKAYLPVNEQGQLVLTLERAFELALLHSSDYQSQLEQLYLSALDVSLERFGFDTQGFAGFNSFVQRRGRARTSTGFPSTQQINSLGANGEGISFRRLGTTGANYAVGLANTILFNISGPSSPSANSLVDFSLVQPLLRGAGRDRIMEGLTQAERTLLANVRQLERYRRGFYLQIATGRPAGAGPNRAGNFLQPPAGANLLTGGYYGLLIQQTQIRNQEFNVRQLQAVLEQFRELYNVGRLDGFQLRFLESNVFNQQSSLVNARIRYQAALDRFAQTLGLPPDLNIVIEDDTLDQFQLISDELNGRLSDIADLRKRTGERTSVVVDLIPKTKPDAGDDSFKWNDDLAKKIAEITPFLDEAKQILAEVEQEDFVLVRRDLDRLDAIRGRRVEYLQRLQSSGDAEDIVSVLDESLYSAESIPTKTELLDLLEGQGEGIPSALQRLRGLHSEIEETKQLIAGLSAKQVGLNSVELFEYIKKNIEENIPTQMSALNNISLELSLLQARARTNSIEINEVNINSETAIAIARCFRRDWMNARASLVDNWRRIEFVADQLEAQLDLVFQAEIGTIGSNPLNFRDANGQIRAGFRFDTPMVRMIERNQYREALIRYSQSRRQYYQFEDEVKRNLRDIVRNLNRDKVLFELNRRAIQNQIEQIELSRLNLEAPPPAFGGFSLDAGAQGGGGGGGFGRSNQFGDSAARNLADAFNLLNTIQNQFVGNWVEYEVLRQSLDFDMGTMLVDPTGAWIDPGTINNTIGLRAAEAFGVTPDCEFCGDEVFNPQVAQTGDSQVSENQNGPVEPAPNQPDFEPVEEAPSNSLLLGEVKE